MKKAAFILMLLLPMALSAQVANTGTATPKANATDFLSRYSDPSKYTFFEIGEEMFKAFCELEQADSMSIELFKKIKSVKMLELRRSQEYLEQLESEDPENQLVSNEFYNQITSELDMANYTQLLRSSNNRSLALLLKKELAPGDNEFLLITDHLVIDIRGDIMIKTIYQMEEMMGYVRQILPD